MATHKTLLKSSTQAAYNVVNTIMHMHTLCRKMADYTYGFQWRECWISATELFREKPTNFLTSVVHWAHDSIFRTNRHSRGEMWHTDPPTVTLLCMQGGLIMSWHHLYLSYTCRSFMKFPKIILPCVLWVKGKVKLLAEEEDLTGCTRNP